MRKVIHIQGMSCLHCQMRVSKALQGIEGIESVDVRFVDNQAIVSMNEGVSEKLIQNTIKEAGYKVKKIEDIQ